MTIHSIDDLPTQKRRKRDRLTEGITVSPDRDQLLKSDIQGRVHALKRYGGSNRIAWDDLDAVKAATIAYLEGCAQSGVFPTVLGLCAHGYGCTRQAVNQYIQQHPHTPTTGFLLVVKEALADLLIDTSLHGQSNVIQCIFVLKNCHGFKDSVEIQAAAEPQMSDRITPDEIMARIAELDE